ncbi:Neurexin-3, variant 2 [Clonorchis sinensis]|uniref:Neurexin-3, variant 2 n=2 Tax=Clonorchis sinensis TaxID=79923 RepID=A0A8T1LT49_CLOSI|nr:Neurexin-3, variant 2 [Clonorchis sinensis]
MPDSSLYVVESDNVNGLVMSANEGLIRHFSILDPSQCPWLMEACPKHQFAIQFDIQPIWQGRRDEKSNVLTIRTRQSVENPTVWVVQFVMPNSTTLSVSFYPEDHMDRQCPIFPPQNLTLSPSGWTRVSALIRAKTGELMLDKQQTLDAPAPSDAKRASLLHRNWRSLASLLREIPTNRLGKLEAMDFGKDSYVRYDFKNRLKKTADREELSIEFEVPRGVENGLIWFVENNASKSFVYLKDGRLHYTFLFVDRTRSAQLTLTEEIYLNTPLQSDRPHLLSLVRDRDNLTLTLNERSHASKHIDGRIPLVPSDGNAYLGGSQNPAKDTAGKVTETFRGRITKAQVAREGDKKVDLLQVATDRHWNDSVVRSGGVRFEIKEPKVKLVIGPTASRPLQSGFSAGSSPIGMALSREPVQISFRGTQNSVVRFDTWDFVLYRSFEIEFVTYEPNGILFFVGPDREHTDFVCVELYDGNVYFVYAVGDHFRHIQLNPDNMKVNTGMSNRVYVSRNEHHQFLVKFNDRVVDVDQGKTAHQAEFATYTYIGGVDHSSRLPWHVWSRENFAGCIPSIRINDDKFLKASSRMSQHTDASRGIEFGVCRVPDRRCTREICGGGQCAERSYPYFEPLNFACDCSGSDKTFRDGVTDIRRSEACFRDAPILEMDGEMVYLIDFDRQLHTMTTHTDDISLQFRTQQSNAPLFYAVSPADKSYFRVDLSGGRIRIQTNINHVDNRFNFEQYSLASGPLDDNQWHTLRIRRRAEYMAMSIDGIHDDIVTIPLQSHLNTFQLIAQQIYLGSAGPSDYSRPPPPGSEQRFLPPPPRFVGEFRNFYWNEYDFIGTASCSGKYGTDMLTPRAELPTFPQWPREPTYSITLTYKLNYTRLAKVFDMREAGDMWLIEFKTEYDGVLLSAREPGSMDQVHITLVLLRGRLHVVYNVHGRSGVHQITSGPTANNLNDGRWHRIVIGLDRRKKELVAFLDSYPPQIIGIGLPVNRIQLLNFYFGGLPDTEWQSVWSLLRSYAPGSLQSSDAEHGRQPAFTGCIGGFSMRSDKFASDLLRRHDSELTAYPPTEIVRGFCREQKRCTNDYCYHGRCEQVSEREIRCICTGTQYEGPRCETLIVNCPPNYCNQRGVCTIVNGQPKCDCSGSGYHGERCELSPCTAPGGYCYNGGVCSIRGGLPYCDCRGTGFYGDRCRDPICPPNYCYNRGRCHVDANERPVCDCQGTGYIGPRCEQTACTPDTCDNGGKCVVNSYGVIECICTGTGFRGPQCRTPICTSDYCSNRGRCVVGPNEQPMCDCTGTGYTGERCHISICQQGYCANGGRCVYGPGDQPRCECQGTGYTGERCHIKICADGYCANGGRCTVNSQNQPVCDCSGTGFGGSRCTDPICRPGFCQNGGRCYLNPSGQPTCACEGTGFTGSMCQTPVCSNGYCLNGGRCSVDANNQPVCNCAGTEHRGSRCETPICSHGHCMNGGTCRVNELGQPVCDCLLTNYQGPRCEIPICPTGYCGGRGTCVVVQRKPTCNCHSGYRGSRCEIEVCPENYCINGGYCRPGPDRTPICTCPPNYEGDRCELPKTCPSDYCFHGGRCTMVRGVPQCDCLGTDYTGSRCETPQTCPVGFCQNGGRCSVQQGNYVCDCTGTGYRGIICNEPIACPPNYCLFGGICSVLPDKQYVCDCSRTARTGKHCEGSSNGIYVTYEKEGYLIYPLSPYVRTVEDNVTLGFRTYMQSGTLITFMTTDGRHWAVKLRDGRLMLDVDGKNVYALQTRSNDGHYHVINIERRGDTMIVTQDTEVIRVVLPGLVNPSDKSITYSALHIAADEKKSDVFRGVIGGVYWNGRYPIDELKAGRVTPTGEVTIVLTPEFQIFPPKPQPICSPGYCLNQGICYAENYQLKCDCSNSGWNGARCERQSRGFMPTKRGNGAYVIYRLNPPKRTTEDEMRVAFQTWAQEGPITRVILGDGSYFDIVLRDGRLYVSFNGVEYIPISSSGQEFSDARMHVVTMRRNNRRFNFTVDGYRTLHEPRNFVGIDGSQITREIVLGADRDFQKTFDGVIGAFYWNGQYLIDERGSLVSDANVMVAPGRQPSGNMEEVVVVLMPHLLQPITTEKPGPPKPLPDRIPEGSNAGGVVMPGLGTGNVNLGAPIFVPGKVYGGGGAGMNAGTGLMLKQAGGILGMGGLIDALLAGLLLALLLLISALIWACWRCKPGCCPWCFGKSGAGMGASAWDRLIGVCCAPPKEKDGPLLANGKDIMDTGPAYITPTHTVAAVPDTNIYSPEGLKVDCVLITSDSRYFVTGSGMGPPKTWDAKSGEIHQIMEGNEAGCTDLHLACNDTVLVTQVVDDFMDTIGDPSALRIKRLQLWDFATGHQLEMPVEVMCTATCLARASHHVIVARCTPSGPTILVWNLSANAVEREIPYEPFSPLMQNNVSYLNISHDDRLVVAGYKVDEQAHYMVFDIAANYPSQIPIQPHTVVFDAEVGATEIIGPDQAVTGTRKGELLVWNLHTREVIRQIQITATLDRGNLTTLPPHHGTVHCVKLSDDKHYLVTGAQDQLVRVWTMPDERLLHTLEGHADDVLSVDISKDNELVVSGSWDGSIRVWRLSDGNQICWFSSNIEILQVKISNDKQSLVALGERNDHRKLITLRVVRNRVRKTTTLRPTLGRGEPVM